MDRRQVGTVISFALLIVMFVGCGNRSVLRPPSGNSGVTVPLYPNRQRLEVDEQDRNRLVEDFFGVEGLLYSSSTDISWTGDLGREVTEYFDESLPKARWRIHSHGWSTYEQFNMSSWRNGDLRLDVLCLDNLNSQQMTDLRRSYGISGPEPGSALMILHMWDINEPLPTATPTPTPVPSPTPTSPPTPTFPPDTAAGSVLQPGEVWRQNGMEMRLKGPSFVPGCRGFLGFEMTIENRTGGELVVNISGLDFEVSDDAGQSYSNIWWKTGAASQSCYGSRISRLEIPAMQVNQRTDLAFRVLGEPSTDVSRITVTVYQAGRIQQAKWEIEVPK